MSEQPDYNPKSLVDRHPIIINLLIIIVVAILGLLIVFFSIAIFTKHGQSDRVPAVENMTYTQAIEKLHEAGFRVDIRDSLYKDDVKPGYVIEQFPKANSIVKPGRKIFLYINAVHPKEVVIDDDNHPMEDALRSFSLRSGLARLQELGFKNVKVVKILGDNDCIVKVLANGVPVKKMQKVPVNASLVVQVYDGRLTAVRDSLQNEELIENRDERLLNGETFDFGYGGGVQYTPSSSGESEYEEYSGGTSGGSKNSSAPAVEEEEIEYY